MGNRPNDVKPPQKNQASQALLSGETGGRGDKMGQGAPVFRIPLVQLNLLILSQISKGDKVKITWKENGFYCFFKTFILGKIPANYNKKFNQSHSYNGLVFSFREQPPAVTVEVYL